MLELNWVKNWFPKFGKDIKHSQGWHALHVKMDGDHIQCYYDGQKYQNVKDSTFEEAGKIGLWTNADAQGQFDDLTLMIK
jgi:hypothetical protein